MSAKKKTQADQVSLDDVIITEPKKEPGVVGESIWGPYKAHAGSSKLAKYSGGPHGLGEPEDDTLRTVEKKILIPNMMKKKANEVWCKEQNQAFFKCAKEYGMTRMNWKCRAQAQDLRACGLAILADKEKVDEATRDYLDMRAEYRRTGQRKLLKRM